jgi:hypothetical protein
VVGILHCNNSRSMQTSINSRTKVLQTSIEALNPGRSSQQWSASRPPAILVFRRVLTVVVYNNSRSMQTSINGRN